MVLRLHRGGREASADELREHLTERFPDWWLSDEFEFPDEIPRTSVGKFDEMALRERLDDVVLDAEY